MRQPPLTRFGAEDVSGVAQADVFRRQAAHFTLLGSPLYGRLAGQLAEDPRPAGAILGDDASWDLGLRLFGAVRHHVLVGVAPRALSGDWDEFETALEARGRPKLIRGDYVDVLPGLLARRSEDALTVVFQTASTGYLGHERYDALLDSLERAGVDGRPLAWVSSRRREERTTEGEDHWELELRVWPEPARLVALADYHGNWVDRLET